MKNEAKQNKVKIYKEVMEKGKKRTICKTVTEEQAELVVRMREAADYLARLGERFEKEANKIECFSCKESFIKISLENFKLSNEFLCVIDKYVALCDFNGEIVDLIQK